MAARHVQLAAATLFLLLGFNVGSWSARLPALMDKLALDTAGIGVLLLACGLGSVGAFPITTALLPRLGSRRLACLAACLLPMLLLALAWAPNFAVALPIMVAEGVLCALMNAAMNSQAMLVETRHGQAIMARLHAMFSLGLLLAALFSSTVMRWSPSLLPHFAGAAALMLTAIAVARGSLLDEPASAAPARPGRRWQLPNRATRWLGLLVFFSTLVEGSMYDWSTIYLQKVAGATPQQAPLGIAVVSTTMLATRLVADHWRSRWGARALIWRGGLLAGASLGAGLMLGGVWPTLAAFLLVGVGVAALSPCIYAESSRHGAGALAAVTTMGSIGTLLGPPVIGFVAQHSGLVWGMGMVATAAFLVAACSLAALPKPAPWLSVEGCASD
ncbi:MFS transporter [Rugamonas rubra]|uniref:Nitrate/nitrite transporter NarK n=1 Tax=Rugamonas rubra TaxID=758825 RepID=A0A1I4SP79_9BURK|nr:MFS transporter [Rugamonas rubra]SFM66197.1 Nitrate/nitrite transporter NarK [Rugamonas rubra]